MADEDDISLGRSDCSFRERNVFCESDCGILHSDDIKAVLLEDVVHTLPAGAVDKASMYENDRCEIGHIVSFVWGSIRFGVEASKPDCRMVAMLSQCGLSVHGCEENGALPVHKHFSTSAIALVTSGAPTNLKRLLLRCRTAGRCLLDDGGNRFGVRKEDRMACLDLDDF